MVRQDQLWTVIPDFEGHEVNSEGQIRNIASGRVLRTSVNQAGVRYVSIQNTTQRRYQNVAVSGLVASVFCQGRTDDTNTVLHLNGDTEDNHASNLMWATHWHTMAYHKEFKNNTYAEKRRLQDGNGRIYRNILDAAMSTGCLPSAIDYAIRYNDSLAKDEHVNFVHRVYPGGHIFRSV